jgi:uncharacterized protein YjbJ (UPF0337 family)
MSVGDKLKGRVKEAAGDLVDDADLRRRGRLQKRKGKARDELARAEDEADRKAEEVAALERDDRPRT